MHSDRALAHLLRMRRAELTTVRQVFAPGQKVVELGGGTGYQASLIAAWGCDVLSLDVESRHTPVHEYYPVRIFDGRTIPCDSGTVDVIFSSHVLEHISHLPALLGETRRILKPDGRAVHVLPTPAWRWWTTVGHYPNLLKRVFVRAGVSGPGTPSRAIVGRGGVRALIAKAVRPGPHGVYPSATAELYYFSKRRWAREFARAGFAVERSFAAGLFYTGYSVFPGSPVWLRARASTLLGSSSRVFVLRRG